MKTRLGIVLALAAVLVAPAAAPDSSDQERQEIVVTRMIVTWDQQGADRAQVWSERWGPLDIGVFTDLGSAATFAQALRNGDVTLTSALPGASGATPIWEFRVRGR